MAVVAAIKGRTQSKTATGKVIAYVTQRKKTLFHDEEIGQKYRLISGQNCVAETAFKEFMATKIQYGKDNGVFYKHYVQSFKPEEAVSPKEIHQMGLELAAYFEGFEVVVATHIDEDHWHNHLIVNSVNAETGLKIQFSERNFNQLRKRSDEICQAHGLETLKPYEKNAQVRGMSTREYRAAEKGNSWKIKLISAVDMAMEASQTKGDFIANMERMGYGVKWIDHYKYITYTTPEGQKCRDNRLHDEKYLKERMEKFYEFRQIESLEQAGQPVNAIRKSDKKISDNFGNGLVRNSAGSVTDFGIDDNRSRQAPSAHAGKNRRAADMGGLERRYSADNGTGDERTHTSRPSIIKQLDTSGKRRNDRIESEDDNNTQQEDRYTGKAFTSTGQYTDQTQVAMDRSGSGVTDAVIGAVVALEHILAVDQPKAEQQPQQIVERKKGKRYKQNKSHNFEISM